MGGGASTDHKSLIEGAKPEEIAAALKELPPDQLAKIRACMKESCPGPVDCSSITVVAKDYKGMLAQPSAPKFQGCFGPNLRAQSALWRLLTRAAMAIATIPCAS